MLISRWQRLIHHSRLSSASSLGSLPRSHGLSWRSHLHPLLLPTADVTLALKAPPVARPSAGTSYSCLRRRQRSPLTLTGRLRRPPRLVRAQSSVIGRRLASLARLHDCAQPHGTSKKRRACARSHDPRSGVRRARRGAWAYGRRRRACPPKSRPVREKGQRQSADGHPGRLGSVLSAQGA
jgi:hypothetical protein